MITAPGKWILVLLLLTASTAEAQIFSGGDPAGTTLIPFFNYNHEKGQPTGVIWNGELRACTSGPDYMVIAGYRYDGIWAIGAGPYDNAAYEVPILSMYELSQDALFDEDDEISAMAATPERDGVYVSFQPIFPTASCLPILRVDFDGTWTQAVTCDELGVFEQGKNRVKHLSTASDGTLYAVVYYQDKGLELVLRIDPSGTPGSRCEQILASDSLLPRSPTLAEQVRILQVAPLDQGRLVVLAELGLLHEAFQEPGWVLVRRDPDGTLTELTNREMTMDLSGIAVEDGLPAFSCLNGMIFDPRDRMLVCGGNGNVFLINPDKPMRNRLIIPAQEVMNTLAGWLNQPVYSPPGGVPGGCLGDVSWGDNRAYATWMGTFMLFNWDTDFLDLDGDHALGFEEAAMGTQPFESDSDEGGTCDGLEFVDFTDPAAAEDDRGSDAPVMRWRNPGLWFGSRAGNSTESRHRLERYGVVAPDGSLLLIQDNNTNELLRFTGWDQPLVPTGQTGSSQGYMAAGPDGSIYRNRYGQGVYRSHPDGTDELFISDSELLTAVGGEKINIIDLKMHPDGRLILGTQGGRLLAVTPDRDVEVLYDAHLDFEAAGLWSEELGCFGGMACELPIGPVVYEPVHGLLLFWLKTDLVGSANFGFMLHLAALLPNGHLRVIADHWAFAEAMGLLGGLEPLDMEPDMKGGLWVLGAGGGGRRLLHLDSRCLQPTTGLTVGQPMMEPVTTAGGLGFISAWDLMVTPRGRIFTPDAYFSNTSGLVPYGLAELAPLNQGIHGGDLLVVQPDEATLSRLLPDGGGELLHRGAPFVRPTAVAAAGGLVAVGDSGLGRVLVSNLDDQGNLGPWTELAPAANPIGMDIDDQARILVVDGASAQVLRIASDGAVEVLAEGKDLGEPRDVVATASGAVAVTDGKNGRVLLLGTDGSVTTFAEVSNPASLALVAGLHYVVASPKGDSWPRLLGPDGELTTSGAMDTSWDLSGDEPMGGVAAAPDGTIYLAMVKGWSWDWQDPFPTLRVFRITTDGYVQSLVRFGLLVGGGNADLCRVRGVGEPLPAEPGDEALPMPVDQGEGELEADRPVGCNAGRSGPVSAWLLLLGLGLFLVRLRQARTRPRALLLLCASLGILGISCSSGAGTSAGDTTTQDTWEPETIASECLGKDLCKPGSPPVCVDGTAGSRRCITDEEGCWVWSPKQACPQDAPCEEGVCGGPWCLPDCGTWNNCGDDGCGGSCGTCQGAEVCCDGICGACQADCTNRECGWDGATGSCGTCGDGKVCVDGTCRAEGQAGCGEFLRDCDSRCQPWDLPCQEQCRDWLSPRGKWDVLTFEGCEFLHCAPCFEDQGDQTCLTACVFEKCALEYATCFNREGTSTCEETWNCAEACDSKDQPCIDGCTGKATLEAMLVLVKLVTCVEAVCPPEAPEQERLTCESQARTSTCREEAEACWGPCQPSCPTWATCGPDSCTGLCGICPENQLCNGFECIPR